MQRLKEGLSGSKSAWVIVFYNYHRRRSVSQFFDRLKGIVGVHIVVVRRSVNPSGLSRGI